MQDIVNPIYLPLFLVYKYEATELLAILAYAQIRVSGSQGNAINLKHENGYSCKSERKRIGISYANYE